MTERLPAHVEATGFLRSAEQAGGFGAVLRKGDPERGSLVLLVGSRGEHFGCLERSLASDGGYRWQQVGPLHGAGTETIADWSQKRARFDPDLWLIELDIPSPERFIAETTSQG
jgi:hypothetical protein